MAPTVAPIAYHAVAPVLIPGQPTSDERGRPASRAAEEPETVARPGPPLKRAATGMPRWMPSERTVPTVKPDVGQDAASGEIQVDEGSIQGQRDPVAAATLSAHHAPPPQSHTIRTVVQQMHMAMPAAPDGAVEVRLNPEELGRVQMSISVQDSGVAVSISVDRPETMDLLRRHIDQLAQEFRDLGYRQTSFSFQQNGAGTGGGGASGGGMTRQGSVAPDKPETHQPAATTPAGGIDIRI